MQRAAARRPYGRVDLTGRYSNSPDLRKRLRTIIKLTKINGRRFKTIDSGGSRSCEHRVICSRSVEHGPRQQYAQ